jgi:Transmembrane protein 43
MSDVFTTVSSVSWFSRIGQSLKNIVVGFIFMVISIGGLFWNEGRAVKTARSLDEGAGIVKSIDPTKIDAALQGKLVHFSGLIKVDTQPTDPDFGISAPGIRLHREVEMYQWIETKKEEKRKKIGGSEETITTYEYRRDWSAEIKDSSRFERPSGHTNPEFPITSNTFSVPKGNIGAFEFDSEQLGQFGTGQSLTLAPGQEAKAKDVFAGGQPVSIFNNKIYAAKAPTQPFPGDVRVAFGIVPAGQASVVAMQQGTGVDSYRTTNGRGLFLTEDGIVSAKDMFATAKRNNMLLTWGLRAAGLFALFIAFKAIMSIAGVVADVLPIAGSIVGFGTGIIAAALALVIGTITIAVAWFAYRPLVALGALGVGAAVAVALVLLRAKNPKQPKSQPVVKLG